jgi:hypothetical protein
MRTDQIAVIFPKRGRKEDECGVLIYSKAPAGYCFETDTYSYNNIKQAMEEGAIYGLRRGTKKDPI